MPEPWGIRRKPPASEQFNWISGAHEVLQAEQLDLELPPPDDAIIPADNNVILLAMERVVSVICVEGWLAI